MKFKAIASITALGILVNALMFLVIPVFSMSLLGRTLNEAGIMNTRISGACALVLSVWLWQSRNFSNPVDQKRVANVFLLLFILMVAIDLHGLYTGAINEMGWLMTGVDFLLGCAFLYLVIKKPRITGTMND